MTKSKSSASYTGVPSYTVVFLIHLMNGPQFLNATRATIFQEIVTLSFTKM